MTNKITSLVSSQFSRIRPLLTPRVGLISLVALGALATLIYFLRRKPALPPAILSASPKQQPLAPASSSLPLSPNPFAAAAPVTTVPALQPIANPVPPPSDPATVSPAPVAPESSPSLLQASVPEAVSPNPVPAAASSPQLPVIHSLDDGFVRLADLSPAETVPHFKYNVETIARFPEDGSAQIKSFNGKLDRADGLLRVVNSHLGTQLPETIPVITTTFITAYLVFQKALRNVETKNSSEEKIRNLRPLLDALSQEIALLKGLNNIKTVYAARYANTDKKGLEELNALYEHAQHMIAEHQQQYKSLVQPLAPPALPGANGLVGSIFGAVPNEVTEKEAAGSLSAYCQLYCPGMESHQAAQLAREGQALMKGILSGEKESSKDHETSQLELAQLTWFLTWCALQKKQGAHEGSFAIEGEPGSRIYRFLTSAPYSYKRASSHYVGRSERTLDYSSYLMASSQHHGVDVHNGRMPARKRTVLFELVDTMSGSKNLFFKPENFGTRTYEDYVMHALELGESLQRKSAANGGDDASGMQKERVPDAAKKAFAALLQHLQQHRDIYYPLLKELPEVLAKALDFAKLYGIAFMFEFIRGIEAKPQYPAAFNAFSEPVKATWRSLDHLDKRTGREIYLTPEELALFVEANIL